jgi:hypothetical protein
MQDRPPPSLSKSSCYARPDHTFGSGADVRPESIVAKKRRAVHLRVGGVRRCNIAIRVGKRAAEESMKRTWTIIGVADVPQSFKWYQSLVVVQFETPPHSHPSLIDGILPR